MSGSRISNFSDHQPACIMANRDVIEVLNSVATAASYETQERLKIQELLIEIQKEEAKTRYPGPNRDFIESRKRAILKIEENIALNRWNKR